MATVPPGSFRSLFTASLDAALLTSPDGRILAANPAACRMFGCSEARLIALGRKGVTDAADPRLGRAIAERRRTGGFRGELALIRANGEKFIGEISTASYRESDGAMRSSMIIRDVTERARREKALQESEAYYRGVVEDQTEVIGRIRVDGTYTYINEVFCRLFGKEREELLGRKWQPRAFSADVPAVEAKLRTLAPGNPVVVIENRVHVASGEVRWMQFVNRGFFDKKGRLKEVQFVGRDITGQKLAEGALLEKDRLLRDLAQRLMAVREEEKREYSAALHHELGSLAVGLNARLHGIEEELGRGRGREAQRLVRQARRLFDGSVDQLRKLAVSLRPPDLDLLGLAAALRHHFSSVTRGTGLRVRFTDTTRGASLTREQQTVLFRVAQESLNNVMKHAGARRVSARLGIRMPWLCLSISDDGKGFDADHLARTPGSGLGLRASTELVASLGGRLVVRSTPGGGTRVRVYLPREAASP